MFKIISSNIRFDNPADKLNCWKNRLPLLSETINDFETSILCTQEGRRPQLIQFEESLNDLVLIDSHRKWIKERMYPCIFYRQSEVKLIDSGDFWLSETPLEAGSKSFGSAFPRLCTWAKIQRHTCGTYLLIVNTHLDHVLPETREEQSRVLVEEVAKVLDPTYKLLILGDFNESPTGQVRNKIMDKFSSLEDPWETHSIDEISTFHKFKGSLSKEEGGARIDWILSDKNLSCEKIFSEHHSKDGIYPSDHFPIKAQYKI